MMFDEVFEEDPGDPRAGGGCATRRPREFIFNFVREYDDLEYVNIGPRGQFACPQPQSLRPPRRVHRR